MRRPIAVVVVVVLAAAGIWRCDAQRSPPPDTVSADTEEKPPQPRPRIARDAAKSAGEPSTPEVAEPEGTIDDSETTGVVVGRVLGPDGEPVRATVRASPNRKVLEVSVAAPHRGDTSSLRVTRSDRTGRFELAGLPPGVPLAVMARDADGRRSAVHERVVASHDGDAPELVLRTLRPASLEVRVENYRPGPGGGLPLWLSDGFVGRDPTQIEQGVWRFEKLTPREHVLHVRVPEHVEDAIPIRLGEGEVRQMTIELDRGHTLEGVVRDRRGEPVPRCTVRVDRHGAYASLPPSRGSAKTDAVGRFAVHGLREGPHRLTTHDDLHAPTELPSVYLPRDPLTIEVVDRGRLRVDFAAPAGAPEPARVRTGMLGRGPGEWSGSGRALRGPLELDGVFLGPVTVWLKVDHYAVIERRLDVTPGGTIDLGVIELGPGRTVEGRVVDPDGGPVESATVSYARKHQPWHQSTTTDAAGRFRMEGLPLAPTLRVEAKGRLASDVEVPAGAAPLLVRLRRGARITGRAHGDGLLLAAGWIQVHRVGRSDDRVDMIYTDERGRYETRLRPGMYRFVWGRGSELRGDRRSFGPSEPVELAEGDEIELDLR